MKAYSISGIPVVEGGGNGRAGKLVGILTNRDVRFATDPRQKVAELMTKERLVTVREGVGEHEAKRLLHHHRIEKLLVVDEQYRCVGLITVKDIEKAVANPNACKDEQGRLRVAAATTVGDKGFGRTEQLIDAGVDLVVVDTAHGHSRRCSTPSAASSGCRMPCRWWPATSRPPTVPGADRRRRRRHQGRHRTRARSAPPASSPVSACRNSPPSWMRSRSRATTTRR